MKKSILMFGLLLLTGCGHNMYLFHAVRGLDLSLPCGEGSRIGITLGSSQDVVAAVRGGATFQTTTSEGGGVFSGTVAGNRIVQFKSNLQFNEGNIVKMMEDPSVPKSAKVHLAEAIKEAAVAPMLEDAVFSTTEANAYIGENAVKSNVVQTVNHISGLDRIVDQTPAIVNSVTTPVTDIVHDAVNPLEGTVTAVDNTVKDIGNTVTSLNLTVKDITRGILMIAGATLLLALFVLLYSIFGKKSSAKKVKVDGHIDELVDNKVIEAPPTPTSPTPAAEEPSPATLQGKAPKVRSWIVQVFLWLMSLLRLIPAKSYKVLAQKAKALWVERKSKKK